MIGVTLDASRRIGTSNDILVTIKDDGDTLLTGVQSFDVDCAIEYTKIDAISEAQPTGYHISSRTYTVTLKKVHLLNTDLAGGDLSFYNKRKWKDFELVIEKLGTGLNSKDRRQVFRNCYRVQCGENTSVGDITVDTMVVISHNMGYEYDDKKYTRRKHIIYGGFTFPYNPYNSKYTTDRKYIEHKFPGLKHNDVEDFGANCGIITCEGYFYGSGDMDDGGAYYNWKQLLAEYKKKGVKKFYHPIFTGVTEGLMVNLQGEIDNRASLIKYSFDIIEYNPPTVSKAKKITPHRKKTGGKKKTSSKKTGKVKSKGDIKVGDAVYITGYIYKTPASKDSVKKLTRKKMIVTKIGSGAHPIHLGTVGWAQILDLSWT